MMKENSLLAIVAAAGSGKRFESELPKQYHLLNNKTVLERALEPFINSVYIKKLIVVISDNDEHIKLQNFFHSSKIEYVIGGKERHFSILNALNSVDLNDFEYVITHDAARPNINDQDIKNLYSEILKSKSYCSYFYLPIYDSIKIKGKKEKTIDKDDYFLVQTPQICKGKELKDAIDDCVKNNIHVPDESFAIERANLFSSRVIGKRSNIKITDKSDISLLDKFITRAGIGFDLHRYESGTGITLGGYNIECEFRIIAHSDGDVLLHSIADSILGAAGLGDIGKYFSDQDISNKDLDSKKIIDFCIKSIKDKKFEIYNLDATIICESPKINPHRESIIANLSNILNITSDKIGLKATTSEKIGIIGNNKAIAVQSLVNLKKIS